MNAQISRIWHVSRIHDVARAINVTGSPSLAPSDVDSEVVEFCILR